MPSPLIVVTGTGTEIGKTHASVALLLRWGITSRVCGVKPIETGVVPGAEGDDARRLREASTFHVKRPFGRSFEPPVSPHLAARAAGVVIDSPGIVGEVASIRADAEGVLVELAGGLFSPLATGLANADVARDLAPTAVVLVAPDRLGVLHDIGAATRAARACGLRLTGVILMAPLTADASTGRNAAEVSLVTDVPVLASYPRASAAELANLPQTAAALATLIR